MWCSAELSADLPRIFRTARVPSAYATILRSLHDEYVDRINMAISEDRYDLARALSDEFTDVSLTAILDAGTTPGPRQSRQRAILRMASTRVELREQWRSAAAMSWAPASRWALVAKLRRLAITWGAWPVRTWEASSA